MKLHQTLSLSLVAVAAVSLLGLSAATASTGATPAPAGPSYDCPDDGSKALNVDTSQSSRTVQLKPSNGSDREFKVIVTKPVWNPKTEMWEQVAQRPIDYKPGSTPAFHVPRGGTATVVDGPDTGSAKPKGDMTVI